MKRIWLVVSVTTFIIFILIDLFLESGFGHSEFPWSHLVGFFALFGFLGCLLIIVVAKLLGYYWLQRGEDYYDKNDDNE
jgi:hypothetical protein